MDTIEELAADERTARVILAVAAVCFAVPLLAAA